MNLEGSGTVKAKLWERQKEYLLIDENGVENIENRFFEANAMKRLGDDYKNSKSYNNRDIEIISTKNAYLDGQHPDFKV